MNLILDPTSEQHPIERKLTTIEPGTINSVAFLDISKPQGSVLLDRLEQQIKAEIPTLAVERYSKPAYTKPAPPDLRSRIASNHQMVILALAD